MESLSFLYNYADLSLFLLRVMVAMIFLASGWAHFRNPVERGKSIGMSSTFTWWLGVVEIVAPIALIIGIYIEIAAILLIIVMLGAIYKKIFVWHSGFWGKGSQGWHYDLLLLIANLVFLTTS